jgi:tRNA 5-methylaminomethyl-2-thiouridine biosynthesis bifunctional protein
MASPLVPATLAFDANGIPYCAAFDDIYHSREGGAGQAQHVFLGGNGLPGRWRGRERFTILETGFGLGLNFLATWSAWSEDGAGAAKLHYVAVEKHPFSATDLAQLHKRYPQFDSLSSELRDAWPMLVPGLHRLELAEGRVLLTLYFGDVATAMTDLRLAADAFYLDGFAPAKNPDMWAPGVCKKLAKHAAPGATFATYTAASSVRDALQAAGFTVEKVPGFATKRDMLRGTCMRPRSIPAPPIERRAIVIGAGLAGSAVCERLAARGWTIDLIERAPGSAREASGNHTGTFHPLVTIDDNIMARLSRASFGYALRHWAKLEGVNWAQCGVLQMPRTDEEDLGQRSALAALAYPCEYARHISRAEAINHTGVDVAEGGVWFERGGWVQPARLVNALLAKAQARTHFNTQVHSLHYSSSGWTAFDTSGAPIAEAPVVILANAQDAMRLCPLPHVELRRVRGQVTYLPARRFPPIRAVLLRGGIALPPVDGIAVAGASYDIGDEDPYPRVDSHAGNLDRLARILPTAERDFDPNTLEGRVGFRAVTRDRLPMVGPLSGASQTEGLHGAFAYASRGILWCSLMAELLASRLEGEPLPIEGRLADAVDPGRFAKRARPGGG